MDMTNAQLEHIYDFATKQNRIIFFLHMYNALICLIVALIVFGLLAFIAMRFRHRPGDGEPEQVSGNLKTEVLWTSLTALALFSLAAWTIPVMHAVNTPVNRPPDVIVNAHQFWWEYRYPKAGVVTANELYLPQGVNSLLEIRSADVAHSFWVPNFGEKMDAIPGHPNHLFLTPVRSGVFLGTCAEFCGADHSLMRIIAKVVSPQDFQAWTASQLKVPAAPTDATALHGQQIFLSQTCGQCHTVAGTPAKGQVAPDLTHVADRQSLGAGVLENNVDNLAKWIKNPQRFKPGCLMPKMHLSDSDAHDIAVYLETLK